MRPPTASTRIAAELPVDTGRAGHGQKAVLASGRSLLTHSLVYARIRLCAVTRTRRLSGGYGHKRSPACQQYR